MDELLQYNKTDYSKGIYYTPTDFFKDIIKKIEIKINSHIKILDFCCGTGNLFFALLENIKNVFDNNVIIDVIKNTTFVDNDEESIKILKSKLKYWISYYIKQPFTINEDNFIICDVLINIDSIKNKFDLIISNPPFINLKCKKEYNSQVKKLNYYTYTCNGIMDTYLLSIERIIKLLNVGAESIIISPTQLFTNSTNKNLIKFMLENISINNIFSFKENNKIFNITQNISVFDITNDNINNYINYSLCLYKDNIIYINKNNSISKDVFKITDYKIVYLNESDISFITHLNTLNKFKDYKHLFECKRGNIDITLDKKYIIKEKTNYPLIRGRNLKSLNINEYIHKDTIIKKNININKKKLVCQQITNISSKNRLYFKIVDENYVISNSCNYIIIKDEENIKYESLQLMLNGEILNRYFSLLSGNNHISIKEINELPILNY